MAINLDILSGSPRGSLVEQEKRAEILRQQNDNNPLQYNVNNSEADLRILSPVKEVAAQGNAINERNMNYLKLKQDEQKRLSDEKIALAKENESFGLNSTERKELAGNISRAETLIRLASEFKDDYGSETGVKLIGDAEHWLSSNVESLSTEGMMAQKRWWDEYNKFYEMKERHELFGAAFTPSESASWNASSINKGMKGAELQKRLTKLKNIAARAKERHVELARIQATGTKQQYFDYIAKEGLDEAKASKFAPTGTSSVEPVSAPQSASVDLSSMSTADLEAALAAGGLD